MKRTILFLLLLVTVYLNLSPVFAAKSVKSSISSILIQRLPVIFPAPAIHEVFLREGRSKELVYRTEGQTVERAKATDLDGDGDFEVVITLGNSGSGGYRDVLLLDKRQGEWIII